VKPRPSWILLPLCALLALAALAPAGQAASGKRSGPGSLLYVQQTEGGSLRHLDSGGFELRLAGVSPRVSTFTDRPRRRAGSTRLRSFIARWGKAGFAADPPNAALVLDRAPRSRDVAMLTLSHPRYNARQETLTYRVKPLRGKDSGALAAIVKRADPVRPGAFGSASLFVDDGAEEVGYATIAATVTNAVPGQRFQLLASPAGGRAGWAIPSYPREVMGVQLTAERPGIPLTELFATAGAITVETALEGPSLSYLLEATLEFEGTDTVVLTANAAPGTTIVVQYPTPQGPQFQELTPGDGLTLTSLAG
jgi:hypothetical protein